MSIKIIGALSSSNDILSDLLVSKYKDEYNLKAFEGFKLNMLNNIYLNIKFLMSGTGITPVISSGFRTPKINKLDGGSSTSQHLYFEAMDLHFYKNGKRITGVDNMKEIANIIDEMFEDIIQQMFWYDWGIHIGIATSRKRLKKVRGAR